jgi:gamma-glutamylcyclotransferase (GGCT)/AIG2-like uncharacterized protein YtfP
MSREEGKKETALLFVYGTLRAGCDGPMARWLHDVTQPAGRGAVPGRLYRVADYPGFVPGPEKGAVVIGDLLVLNDPAATLAILDAHEECTPDFPEPHEYRRVRITVTTPDAQVEAWTYIYGWDVVGSPLIGSGDFLA